MNAILAAVLISTATPAPAADAPITKPSVARCVGGNDTVLLVGVDPVSKQAAVKSSTGAGIRGPYTYSPETGKTITASYADGSSITLTIPDNGPAILQSGPLAFPFVCGKFRPLDSAPADSKAEPSL